MLCCTVLYVVLCFVWYVALCCVRYVWCVVLCCVVRELVFGLFQLGVQVFDKRLVLAQLPCIVLTHTIQNHKCGKRPDSVYVRADSA